MADALVVHLVVRVIRIAARLVLDEGEPVLLAPARGRWSAGAGVLTVCWTLSAVREYRSELGDRSLNNVRDGFLEMVRESAMMGRVGSEHATVCEGRQARGEGSRSDVGG